LNREHSKCKLWGRW